MADLNPFKNCSNFTDEETSTRVVALVRGVSAAVCCVILSTVLVTIVILAILPKARKQLCGTAIKRLTFGTIAVSVAYQLNFALYLVHYYYRDNRMILQSEWIFQPVPWVSSAALYTGNKSDCVF